MLCVSSRQTCHLLSPDAQKKSSSGLKQHLKGCLQAPYLKQTFKRQIDADCTVKLMHKIYQAFFHFSVILVSVIFQISGAI